MTAQERLNRLAQSLAYAYAKAGMSLPADDREVLETMAADAGETSDGITAHVEAGSDVGHAAMVAADATKIARESGERPWGEPIASMRREAVKEMGYGLLPPPLAPWIADIASRACLPVEVVAVPALVGIASLIGRHMVVRPEEQSGWTTPPNLWGAIVARPGLMKSHAIGAALGPIGKLSSAATAEYVSTIDNNKLHKLVLESRFNAMKRTKAPDMRELEEVTQDLESLEITERRYTTSDPTTEKLGELLIENPRGLLLIRDELSGWIASMSKSNREGDRAFYLESWGGDSPYTVDRIGRGTLHIPALCLSVIGAVQPGKLSTLIEKTMAMGEGDDGLLQRVQLLVWPDESPQWSRCSGSPNERAADIARQVYSDTDALCRERWPEPVRFDRSAQEYYDRWRDRLELRIREPAMRASPSYESHIGKYRGLLPSLALVLWVANGGKPPGTIGLAEAEQAGALCAYLETHARKLYASELFPRAISADALLARINDGLVDHLEPLSSIARHRWAGLSSPSDVALAVDGLAIRNIVRRKTIDTRGRPSTVLALHPRFRVKA